MCKYHIISRVWLNLDVSLSAFKSTILRLSNEFWISLREKYLEKESVEILNSIFAILNFYFTELLFQKINLGRLISNDWTILLQGNEESKENWKESKNRWFLPFSRLANDQNIEEIMFTLSLFSHIFYRELEIFERMKWKKFNSKWFNSIRFDFLILIIFEK